MLQSTVKHKVNKLSIWSHVGIGCWEDALLDFQLKWLSFISLKRTVYACGILVVHSSSKEPQPGGFVVLHLLDYICMH